MSKEKVALKKAFIPAGVVEKSKEQPVGLKLPAIQQLCDKYSIKLDEEELSMVEAVYWIIQFNNVQQTDDEMLLQAIKLSSLFGNINDAVSYIERVHQHYTGKQLVHDACLFQLPEGDWDKLLWRGLLKNNPPVKSNDLVLRILPFAVKIQEFVHHNESILKDKITASVMSVYKKKCAVDFNKINTKDTSKYEERMRKGLKKNWHTMLGKKQLST